jgi:hypothetical protein
MQYFINLRQFAKSAVARGNLLPFDKPKKTTLNNFKKVIS